MGSCASGTGSAGAASGWVAAELRKEKPDDGAVVVGASASASAACTGTAGSSGATLRGV